ncbi:MAG: hypothetical protein E7680_00300 [Ruminococcaceae bacterium]|nr:hypothetical protein [Oscillospiraceae bacterium]
MDNFKARKKAADIITADSFDRLFGCRLCFSFCYINITFLKQRVRTISPPITIGNDLRTDSFIPLFYSILSKKLHDKKAHQRFPQKTQPFHHKAENSGTTQSPPKRGDHARHTQVCDGYPRELSPAKTKFCPSIPEKSDLIKGKIPI